MLFPPTAWGEWGAWGACSAYCSPGGTRARERDCVNPATTNVVADTYCTAGSGDESQACNIHTCPSVYFVLFIFV